MQIHPLPDVPAPLARVDELPAELHPERQIIGAPSPFPVLHPHRRRRSNRLGPSPVVAVVAVARPYRALAAGPCDGVGDGRARYGVYEGGLPASYKTIDVLRRFLDCEP